MPMHGLRLAACRSKAGLQQAADRAVWQWVDDATRVEQGSAMNTKDPVTTCLMDLSSVQLHLSTFQSCTLTLKHLATQSAAYKSILASPGISFGSGDPNLFSTNFGHMSPRELQDYVSRHGPLDAFICELAIMYLFQRWEHSTRPTLKKLTGQMIESDVFGDLRLIRHALQHEKHHHLFEAERIDDLRMFRWLVTKNESRLTGDAFDAIFYAVSLEIHRINNRWGNGPSNITAIPSFVIGSSHVGLKDLTPQHVSKLEKIGWYSHYVMDLSKSNILLLEKEVLGDLHK
jgi:hypothetical protein